MKLIALRAKLDAFVGLKSFMYKETDDKATLTYIVVDTNTILFDIHLFADRNEGWKVDSIASTFNYRYAEELRNMHREE